MKTHCQRCGLLFARSTRNNRICSACHTRSQKERLSNRSYYTKKTSTISINNKDGMFAGFITADNDKELMLIKLPRGYKHLGAII